LRSELDALGLVGDRLERTQVSGTDALVGNELLDLGGLL